MECWCWWCTSAAVEVETIFTISISAHATNCCAECKIWLIVSYATHRYRHRHTPVQSRALYSFSVRQQTLHINASVRTVSSSHFWWHDFYGPLPICDLHHARAMRQCESYLHGTSLSPKTTVSYSKHKTQFYNIRALLNIHCVHGYTFTCSLCAPNMHNHTQCAEI